MADFVVLAGAAEVSAESVVGVDAFFEPIQKSFHMGGPFVVDNTRV